jgi:hypothetical protein
MRQTMANPRFLLANEAARETQQQAEELRRRKWERRDQQDASSAALPIQQNTKAVHMRLMVDGEDHPHGLYRPKFI